MKTDYKTKLSSLTVLASMLLSAALGAFSSPATTVLADHTPAPGTVTLAGSLQSELGCPGDWQPDCAVTHFGLKAGTSNDGVYRLPGNLPAGSYEYKVALNDSWSENYGANAAPNGPNIAVNLSAPATVRFYYSHKTHWVTSNLNSRIATMAGSFQSELGCPGDWQPDCMRSWLQDPDGDGIYTFVATGIPAGTYEFKVALDEGWAENYGSNGIKDGANLSFTVAGVLDKVTFKFDSATNTPSASVQAGGPSVPKQDNNVEYNGLGHNSQDLIYHQPFGAVNPNTPITLRFRTFANDVTGVKVRLYDSETNQEFFQTMTLEVKGISCYDPKLTQNLCDWWSTTYTPPAPTTLYYRFIVKDGTSTAYYADDKFKDGGLGEATPEMIDNSYVVTVFDPAFKPVPWMKDAVIYQIFPDRFRDGDKSNNPNGQTEPRYSYPANPLDQIINKQWNELPEGYCRKYVNPAQPCNEDPRGRDYFGGDLKGVSKKLEYLQKLGVTVIYFNPIFEAGSDHAYDTQDYKKIDHFFGTQKDWEQLVKKAKERGIRIVLDGVFNHVSSDSPYFDRYGHFSEVGACESVNSVYRDWFFFQPKAGGPCAGPSGPNTMDYEAWFGFDSLPVLNKNSQAVRDLVYARPESSVGQYWLKNGAAGWRLDVMGDGSFPAEFWQQFRTAIKKQSADAIIIGELWKKEEILPKIHGDQADTTMNYRFRNAILGFFGTVDDKGFADDGASNQPPSLFARKLNSLREDYPDATYYTLMNIMDSHDTQRILWSLTPGARNREARELNPANLALGKQRLKLATLVQMTYPGAPTIYYGDEVALNGDDDPDDRRPFPWTDLRGSGEEVEDELYQGAGGDHNLLDHYRKLTALRASRSELRNGDLKFLLLDDDSRTMAYGMREAGKDTLSIVAVNRNEGSSQTLRIPLTGYLRNGVSFTNVLGGGQFTSVDGYLTVTLPALGGALLVVNPQQDITGPTATSVVQASASNGKVNVNWSSIAGSSSYALYRTQLSGGGYELLQVVNGTSYEDNKVVNGKRYYYAVRGLDAAGNEGTLSKEAGATPSFPIGYAVLKYPKTIDHVKGITPTPTIYGQTYVAGITDANGPTDSILAEVGFGSGNPDTWTGWVRMSFNVKSGNNYEYQASLVPEVVGTFDLLVRFSTDGGLTWSYGDQDGFYPGESGTDEPGKLNVSPNPDQTPPLAPTNLRIENWSAGFIKIAWDKVSDAAQYRIYRGTTSGGFDYSKPLAKVDGATTSFTDDLVGNGTTYYYVVRAYDAALNASGNSNQVSQKAAPKLVKVTFRVRVPAETPASDIVYLPGSIDLFGPWNPGKHAMTSKGGGLWETTVEILDGTALEYKYTRGAWERVEWWGSIVSTANRSVSISYGTDGTQVVDNTATNWGSGADTQKAVQAWRDPLVASASGTAANVTVNFSRNIQPDGADYSASIVVTRAGANVAGTVAASGTTGLVWTPSAALTPGTYTVTVNKVKSSLSGDSVSMQAPYTFTFTV